MEKLVIYKNKDETFKCQLQVEGADADETMVRLCLEFEDNINMFFYGAIQKDGQCEINIPKLKDFPKTEGKLVVEAVADSIYFKVFESPFEFKNAVEVSMNKTTGLETKKDKKVKIENVSIVREQKPVVEIKPVEDVIEEVKEVKKPKASGLTSFKNWKKA